MSWTKILLPSCLISKLYSTKLTRSQQLSNLKSKLDEHKLVGIIRACGLLEVQIQHL